MKFFNKIASCLMCAAALTTSCSQDVMESNAVASGERVVTFTINEPVATRGSIITNDTFNAITIYVVNSESQYTSYIKMEKDSDGYWSQTNIASIPVSGTTTFYAVGDQNVGGGTSGVTFVNDGVNTPYVSYEMPETIADQPTLVMSAPVSIDEDTTLLNVELNFFYTLSFVGFTTSGEYDITSLSIENFYDSANIAFGETYDSSNFTFGEKQESPLTFSLLESKDYTDINYLMIPLQNLDGAVVKANLSYNDKYVETKEYTMPANTSLLTSGYVHYYNITTGEYVDTSDVTIEAKSYAISMLVDGTYDTAVTTSRETTITWESNDKSIATVEDGVITGVKGGETTITATPLYGDAVTFTVTVYYPITGIELEATEVDFPLSNSPWNSPYYVERTIYPVDESYREPYSESISIIYDTYYSDNTLTGSPDYVASCNVDDNDNLKYLIYGYNVGVRELKVGVKGTISNEIFLEELTINIYDPEVGFTIGAPGNPEIVEETVLGGE